MVFSLDVMIKKLADIEKRYSEIEHEMARPEVIADTAKYRELSKALSELSDLVSQAREYRSVDSQLKDARAMLKEKLDREMEEFVRAEVAALEKRREELDHGLKLALLPQDPNDGKDAIVEIRAGAGGEEASLFARDLFRMYTRYAERKKWQAEILSSSPSDMGGFKEVSVSVKGRGAFGELKYESGVHRVQRIPVTESGGRIHTSTATVAVLPEAQEVEVGIEPKDLKVETFRASGPGGQHVNVTDSAVRITHVPTGIIVSCQNERSQLQNKDKAMRVLRARLYTQALEKQQAELAEERRIQIGTGDRSEKIRTYNFPQTRVTDHRINLTTHQLNDILEGDLGDLIGALAAADKAKRLEKMG